MTSLQVKLLEPLSLSPGVLRCRWCFGARSVVLLVGLLDVRGCLLLGQVPREVVPWVDGSFRSWPSDLDNQIFHLRNNGNKRQRHPKLGSGHEKSFFPYFTLAWNKLPQSKRNNVDIDKYKSAIKCKCRPQKYKFYSHGTKLGNKLITRLRVNRSFLNARSDSTGHYDTPHCSCGCGEQETTLQYLIRCETCQKLIDGTIGTKLCKVISKRQNFQNVFGYKPDNCDYNQIN